MAQSKNKKGLYPNWRPNFRDPGLLPDVKVVRTHFLLNFLAVVACFGFAGAIIYTEFTVRSAAESVEFVEENIARNQGRNTELVRMSGEFSKESQSVEQLTRFFDLPFTYSEVLRAVAETRPRPVVFNSFSFSSLSEKRGRVDVLRYRIQIQGTVTDVEGALAPETANQFRDELSQLPGLAGKVESSRLSSFNRTENPAVFNFTIQMMLDPEKK